MGNRGLFAFVIGFFLIALLCLCGAGGVLLSGRGGESALLPTGRLVLPGSAPEQAVATGVPSTSEAAEERGPAPTAIALPADALALVRAEEELLNRVYEALSPSVVNISVSGNENSVFGEQGEGSGFVWDKEGHIVTNNHVVENAETILVTFSDTTQLTAEIVGTDPDSDLAVIRVEADPEFLQPVATGDSAALRVGQRVIAIGNPFGFDRTLTLGVVSALGRTVPSEIGQTTGGNFSIPNLVQTDAAINPGNSGGPLLDIEGRVIGVNTLIYSTTGRANSGVGFAIPVNKVEAVVPELIAKGIYETPYLGISSPRDLVLTPRLAELLELENVSGGVLVDLVVPEGPSDDAGVRGSERELEVAELGGTVRSGGDVIVGIDGQLVRQFDDVINYLDTRRVGDVITLSIIRDGEPLELPVTLGARPE